MSACFCYYQNFKNKKQNHPTKTYIFKHALPHQILTLTRQLFLYFHDYKKPIQSHNHSYAFLDTNKNRTNLQKVRSVKIFIFLFLFLILLSFFGIGSFAVFFRFFLTWNASHGNNFSVAN